MKLLVTGGCGFLGSNLAAAGLARGWEVQVFDNLSRLGATDNLAWLRSQGLEKFQHGDIRNQADVDAVVRNFQPDCVFHLAGQVAMTTSIERPRTDFEINALGSLNLLEAVRAHVPQALTIYSSTNKVYGDLEQYRYQETETRFECVDKPRGFDESTPLEFHSPYGCSKGAADQYMQDYARIFGLRTVVLRHSSMYGGRQFATADQGWVGWFCSQALAIKQQPDRDAFTISGTGKQVRDVLHARDMIALYFSLIEQADRVAGQAFNVGGGIDNSLSLLELFGLLEELCGVTMNFRRLPARESDQRVFVADISRLEQLIGWRPAVSAREGVQDMLSWLQRR